MLFMPSVDAKLCWVGTGAASGGIDRRHHLPTRFIGETMSSSVFHALYFFAGSMVKGWHFRSAFVVRALS
jgi:hypothetical protein